MYFIKKISPRYILKFHNKKTLKSKILCKLRLEDKKCKIKLTKLTYFFKIEWHYIILAIRIYIFYYASSIIKYLSCVQ